MGSHLPRTFVELQKHYAGQYSAQEIKDSDGDRASELPHVSFDTLAAPRC